ncbi:hypothetical protein H257_03052 [Aphanomyces astaci]|uniref:Uncharacterized protein n=1 Tax=Aphanomyces astaci TaxID=112090 RepID=W4H1V6_APHAT|nr:hypothetical protein H257_03052 [Aphanomyces astaci]ETV85239.1 hypothetical protein H257_03052 [Aphanomyces astaci]|eukprot:XP_009825257.1 hypothetical protein H257_03052 [Aphanomyces astaci]
MTAAEKDALVMLLLDPGTVAVPRSPLSYADELLAPKSPNGANSKQVIKGGRITHTWVDDHYPHVQEGSPQWNMLLQAICNSTTPRVACATGLTSHDRMYPAPMGVAAAVLVVALIACVGLRRHPILGRFYPTNVVVVASLGLLAVVVYQGIVVDVSL